MAAVTVRRHFLISFLKSAWLNIKPIQITDNAVVALPVYCAASMINPGSLNPDKNNAIPNKTAMMFGFLIMP